MNSLFGTSSSCLSQLRTVVARISIRVTTPVVSPMVTMEGFGDNALTLVLRCYLESLDCRLAVTSELFQAIDDKFRSAGIGIAFPQRDIHLRASEPLDVRLHRADRPAADG